MPRTIPLALLILAAVDGCDASEEAHHRIDLSTTDSDCRLVSE